MIKLMKVNVYKKLFNEVSAQDLLLRYVDPFPLIGLKNIKSCNINNKN